MVQIISLEKKKRQLEAQLQVAWAKATCSVLRSMADGAFDGNPAEAMREFVELYDVAEKASTDPEGRRDSDAIA
jgi:hypothetical protein